MAPLSRACNFHSLLIILNICYMIQKFKYAIIMSYITINPLVQVKVNKIKK